MRFNTLSISDKVSQFTPEQLDELNGTEHLYVTNTNMVELPPLPDSLTLLVCRGNKKLTSLPDFESTDVTTIKCYDNKLETLNLSKFYKDELFELQAYNNNLKVFPKLPDGIKILYLSGNPFTKKKEELSKYINYVKNNDCINDLDDIIDIKSYSSSILLSKTGTIGNIPKSLSNGIPRYFYNDEGGIKKTRKSIKKREKKTKKDKKSIKKKIKKRKKKIVKRVKKDSKKSKKNIVKRVKKR